MLAEINLSGLSGEVYALLTACAWAVAVLLYKKCGQTLAPAALNLFKNVTGLIFLLLSFFFVNESIWPAASWQDFWILFASGAIGIGIADTIFFMCLNLLGASRTAIVDCLYSPFVILVSWVWIGEKLNVFSWIGAGLIVLAVLMLFKKQEGEEVSRTAFIRGVFLGAMSMALMAVGIVLAKPTLNQTPVLWATTVRMIGGVTAVILLGETSSARPVLWQGFKPSKLWFLLIPSCFIGSYLCLIFWIAGMKYTQTNTASILNQTSSVFIVLLAAIFLKEPLDRRKAAAVGLAFCGSVLVFAGEGLVRLLVGG